MPIYEFKCLSCSECFELLVINKEETIEAVCPKCKSEDFERIMSTTRYSIGSESDSSRPSCQTRTCSGGSCTTYDIPGPAA